MGVSFCKLLKRGTTFSADFDAVGSFVWQHCDGHTTVQHILHELKKEFPHEKHIDQRLFLFLQQMKGLHYLDL